MKLNRTLENPVFFGAKPKLFERANELRKNMTETEKILWQRLRHKKLDGFKFRRQHPLIQFVADFYCHEARLVIEIDGGYHLDEEQKENDENRTYELEQVGINVIRFTNDEVINHIEEVIERIKKELPARPPFGVDSDYVA